MNRIPVAIAANPTVEDVLVEKIERDESLIREDKIQALMIGRKYIAEYGITQI